MRMGTNIDCLTHIQHTHTHPTRSYTYQVRALQVGKVTSHTENITMSSNAALNSTTMTVYPTISTTVAITRTARILSLPASQVRGV